MRDADRIEDLETCLNEIVLLLNEDGDHEVTDRDNAAMEVALNALGLSEPPATKRRWKR